MFYGCLKIADRAPKSLEIAVPSLNSAQKKNYLTKKSYKLDTILTLEAKRGRSPTILITASKTSSNVYKYT